MVKHVILVYLAAFTACMNVGFVDKAKAAASGEFGFLVFAMGATSFPGNILNPADASYTSSCTGISGISKGNCLCQNEAAMRGFQGTFRAWLSISGSIDAICNIQGIESAGCTVSSEMGPFLAGNATGYVILAENYGELASTGFRTSLSTTAKPIYTGTNADGRASGSDCGGFANTAGPLATSGDQSLSGIGYTTGNAATCNAGIGSFLCFRQSK